MPQLLHKQSNPLFEVKPRIVSDLERRVQIILIVAGVIFSIEDERLDDHTDRLTINTIWICSGGNRPGYYGCIPSNQLMQRLQ